MKFDLTNVVPSFRERPDAADIVRRCLRWRDVRPPYKGQALRLWRLKFGPSDPDCCPLDKAPTDALAIKMLGHCYTASTVFLVLCGGVHRGRVLERVQQVKNGEGIHWWLRADGETLDLTAEQTRLLAGWAGYAVYRPRPFSRGEAQGKAIATLPGGQTRRLGGIEARVLERCLKILGAAS